MRVNGAAQKITAIAGRSITIDRAWKTGDEIDIAMPMSFRAERAIDDATVQSIYYGPTLLTVQAPPVTAPAGQDAAGGSAATATNQTLAVLATV